MLLTAGACRDVVDPPLPPAAERFAAPPAYARWWAMGEACAGVSRPLAAVAWYVVPGAAQVPQGRGRVSGYWSAGTNQIVLAGDAQLDGALVRHEMLHALRRAAGHPRAAFLDRCGGVVACDGDCLRDAGPAAPADPAAARVAPAALDVTASLAPAGPALGVEGGLFTLTVTVRNPAPHAVVVTLPPRPRGPAPPESFPFAVAGPAGTLVGAAVALDPGVTRFAAGETKRQVFDFAVRAGSAAGAAFPGGGASGAFPPGAYTFRGAYGDHWAAPVAAVLGP